MVLAIGPMHPYGVTFSETFFSSLASALARRRNPTPILSHLAQLKWICSEIHDHFGCNIFLSTAPQLRSLKFTPVIFEGSPSSSNNTAWVDGLLSALLHFNPLLDCLKFEDEDHGVIGVTSQAKFLLAQLMQERSFKELSLPDSVLSSRAIVTGLAILPTWRS